MLIRDIMSTIGKVSLFKRLRLKVGENMALRYKIDIMQVLKEKGYSSYRIRKENIFGQKTLQDFRSGSIVLSADCLDKLCRLLDCQPGDIMEYVEDGSGDNAAVE